MRERLTELVGKARKTAIAKGANSDVERNMLFAEYLLANGVIVPPCKVGDTVWCIIDGFNQVMEGRVRGFTAYENVINIYCGIKGYFERNYTDKEFGKTIFHAKEEAEAALKGGAE